jgi:hypothetical protein
MTRARLVLSFALLAALAAGCGKKGGPASEPGPAPKPSPAPGPSAPTGEAEVAAKAEAVKRLKAVGAAMHAHEKAHGEFPAGVMGPKNDLGLSWRVQLLPHLGEEELYKQFKLEEPWDSPHNKPLVAKMPKVFESAGKPTDPGMTYLQAFYGNMAFLKADHLPSLGKKKAPPPIPPGTPVPGRRVSEITDGTSNTIMLVEAHNPVEWTKPEDLAFIPFGRGLPPVFPLGAAFRGGFHVLLCDGSAHFIPETIPESAVGAMVTINRREPLDESVAEIIHPLKGKDEPKPGEAKKDEAKKDGPEKK